TGVSTTTVTVNPAGSGPTLTLAPPAAGPRVTGSSQQFTATLKDSTGTAVVGATIQLVVTGVNPYSNSGVTNSSGVATFSYTGALAGTDSARASGALAG